MVVVVGRLGGATAVETDEEHQAKHLEFTRRDAPRPFTALLWKSKKKNNNNLWRGAGGKVSGRQHMGA